MWKAPNRPDNSISQSFNDGIVTIYSVEDVALPGYQPKAEPVKKGEFRYEEQRLGITRIYLSRQNQSEIERVLRIPFAENLSVNTLDIAITEKGEQYEVSTVQSVNDVWPKCIDIALTKLKQRYKVSL